MAQPERGRREVGRARPPHRLVLANFLEVFGDAPSGATLGGGLPDKAVLAQEDGAYTLIAPVTPANCKPVLCAWPEPGCVVTPAHRSGSLCGDLLHDKAAWHEVLGACADADVVQVWPQVFSPGVEAVVEALVDAGVRADVENLPRVSALAVRYWNTKVGGRDFLQSVPEVRPILPAALVCNTLVEAVTLIAGEPERGFVVKANGSIGGAGVTFFPPGSARDLDGLVARLKETGGSCKSKGSKAVADVIGPYLVEELVGAPEHNVSPTADFHIHADGTVEFVGIGRQLLAGGVAYRGVSSPDGMPAEVIQRCVTAGRRVGTTLARRGYRGYLNVDFVVDAAGRVALAEMNLRQSAPLDQFLVMRRLFGAGQAEGRSFVCAEDIETTWPFETAAEVAQLLVELPLAPGDFLYPLVVVGGAQLGVRRVSLLAVSKTLRAAERLLAAAGALLRSGTG